MGRASKHGVSDDEDDDDVPVLRGEYADLEAQRSSYELERV
jgi:hypothetical protein